jgi:hypothetical protein
MYLSARDKLMAYCEAHHRFEHGQAHGEAILRHDRARERTHRQMMRLQAQAGDRIAALRQFDRCVAALDEELGVQPSRRTVALYQQIRAESSHGAVRAAAPTTSPTTSPKPVADPPPGVLADATPLADALRRLRQMRIALWSLEQQIDRGIAAIESATGSGLGSTPDGRAAPTSSD